MLKNKRRNLYYFILITLFCGWIGVLTDKILTKQPKGNSLGMGIWLVLPLFCAILFRIREKEWKSFGLALNLKTGWKGYLIAIFVYPFITILTIFAARCLDFMNTSSISLSAFLSAALASFVGSFFKNIFEEFAWRGYLTPRLSECSLNDWQIYGISGLVWGLWHGPYYMIFLGDEYFADSSRLETLLSGCLVMVLWSVLFVEIYRMTKSVWPCVILHTMEDALPTVLMATGSFVTLGWRQVLFDPVTGILSLAVILGIGLKLRKTSP